jgi:iron-sulfur cluster repair protein YtfE (RIC family)
MNSSSETGVKDMALLHPAARRVLEEARVEYCCGEEDLSRKPALQLRNINA